MGNRVVYMTLDGINSENVCAWQELFGAVFFFPPHTYFELNTLMSRWFCLFRGMEWSLYTTLIAV